MWANLRKYFISGMVIFLPVVLTIYLFIWLLTTADSLIGQHIEPFFLSNYGFYVRGIGILILIYIIVLVGFFATNFLGKRIVAFFEGLLVRLPFFKQVYPAIKEMAIWLFTRDRMTSFKQVVLLEYPRKGLYAFGFMTNDSAQMLNEKTKQECCNVFVPSAPGPLTGYVIMVPRKDLIFTDIRVEEAFKFIVSGGVVNPVL